MPDIYVCRVCGVKIKVYVPTRDPVTGKPGAPTHCCQKRANREFALELKTD